MLFKLKIKELIQIREFYAYLKSLKNKSYLGFRKVKSLYLTSVFFTFNKTIFERRVFQDFLNIFHTSSENYYC